MIQINKSFPYSTYHQIKRDNFYEYDKKDKNNIFHYLLLKYRILKSNTSKFIIV